MEGLRRLLPPVMAGARTAFLLCRSRAGEHNSSHTVSTEAVLEAALRFGAPQAKALLVGQKAWDPACKTNRGEFQWNVVWPVSPGKRGGMLRRYSNGEAAGCCPPLLLFR